MDFIPLKKWDDLPEEYIGPVTRICEKYKYTSWTEKTGEPLLSQIKSEIDKFLKTQQVMRGSRLIESHPVLHGDQLTIKFSYVNQ